MNPFSTWILSPQFSIEIVNQKNFNSFSKKSNCISVSFSQPKITPNSLSYEEPGNAHKASHIGSLLACHLLNLIKDKNKDTCFAVTLSDEIKAGIQGDPSEFFVGLLQRSVKNRMVKADQKNSFSVFFADSIFSQTHLEQAQHMSQAMSITRSLINMPANVLNPKTYVDFLNLILKKGPLKSNVKMSVYSYEKLQKEGYGLICAVGQGSETKPCLVKLTYTPKKVTKKTKHISLVGKGITFDSGGYDIKPSSGMRIMKKDMGGSASALGIFLACSNLNSDVRITCYLALAENMVSGNAMRPGDVYTARNGLNVEIDNTDAEGRLVLADALCLACEENPDWLIDLATLTGAARVATGSFVDCLFGNNAQTTNHLYETGVQTGDWVWKMPLPSDYNSYFDSQIADMMNSSTSSFGGSITAALFLQKFVTVKKWNHIDTYMWCDRPNGLWNEGNGPTAKCVRLVTKAIASWENIS
jgi:leucyl aminopeptidase